MNICTYELQARSCIKYSSRYVECGACGCICRRSGAMHHP